MKHFSTLETKLKQADPLWKLTETKQTSKQNVKRNKK